MPTLEVSYAQPSGYFSGSSPASKSVMRMDYAGYPEDSYSLYRITSYYAEWEAQVYISAGATVDFETNGVSFSESMDEAQSTEFFTTDGGSLSNKILDKANTGYLEVDISRNGGSGTGNVAVFKSGIYIKIDYEYAYTNCSAPTSVSVATTTPAAGGTTTLSWSGAKAGTLNPITGYQIYRATSANGSYTLLDTVSTSATSGSLKITAPTSMGTSYYYKIITVGTVSGYNSGYSGSVGFTAITITKCSAPTAISISPTAIDKGGSTTLTWSGASGGTNNGITAYNIYRSTDNATYSLDQTYQTTATSGSLKLTLSPNADTTYYYKIATVGAVSGYNSGYSNVVSVKVSTYTNCGNITISVAASIAEGEVAVSWDRATDGHNNNVAGYKVQYQDSSNGKDWGTTVDLEQYDRNTVSKNIAVNPNRGEYRRFLITPIETKSGYNGATAISAAVRANRLPASPTFLTRQNSGIVYQKKPWIRVSIPADEDGQERTFIFNYGGTDYEVCKMTAEAGTYTFQLPFELTSSTINSNINFSISDGLAIKKGSLATILRQTIPTAITSPTMVVADNYNQIAARVNNLRNYHNLETINFETIASGDIVKAAHTNALLSALEDIHKLLPTTNKFDKVKKGDLITKKTYNQIINGLKEG